MNKYIIITILVTSFSGRAIFGEEIDWCHFFSRPLEMPELGSAISHMKFEQSSDFNLLDNLKVDSVIQGLRDRFERLSSMQFEMDSENSVVYDILIKNIKRKISALTIKSSSEETDGVNYDLDQLEKLYIQHDTIALSDLFSLLDARIKEILLIDSQDFMMAPHLVQLELAAFFDYIYDLYREQLYAEKVKYGKIIDELINLQQVGSPRTARFMQEIYVRLKRVYEILIHGFASNPKELVKIPCQNKYLQPVKLMNVTVF
jgi:hypothetical protein